MEKNTSYAEKMINYYKDYQELIISDVFKLNVFQELYGFKKFNDITIRCCNSNVNAFKELKKSNLKIDETAFDLLLEAYRIYIDELLFEAMDSINRYMNELEMIFIGKQNTLKQRIKELNIFYNPREIFEQSQYNVDNYLKIGDDIIETDIKKDINKILVVYLGKKFEQFINDPNKTLEENIEHFNKMLPIISTVLRDALKKLNLESSIYVLNDILTKIYSTEEELLTEEKKKTRRK